MSAADGSMAGEWIMVYDEVFGFTSFPFRGFKIQGLGFRIQSLSLGCLGVYRA